MLGVGPGQSVDGFAVEDVSVFAVLAEVVDDFEPRDAEDPRPKGLSQVVGIDRLDRGLGDFLDDVLGIAEIVDERADEAHDLGLGVGPEHGHLLELVDLLVV